MKKINAFLTKIFNWNFFELFQDLIGISIFCLGINLFIVPNNLYNGGVLGLSQLLNGLLKSLFHVQSTYNSSGIINFFLNIPILILAYRKVSKTFFSRTIFTILIQTLLLTLIPIPNEPFVHELITNVLIGGVIVGIGSAFVLTASGSSGGTDVIGIVLSSKYSHFSVGKFGRMFNAFVYGISGLLYGIPTMIYSIIYSIVATITVDRFHDQNVCSSAFVFTKDRPDSILEYVRDTLDRDATCWEGKGYYDNTKTYITYLVLSRYEFHKLEKMLKVFHTDAFIVKNDGVQIDGNFTKRLSK